MTHEPKHRGEPRRCHRCGRTEDNHDVRHPFEVRMAHPTHRKAGQ